MNYWKNFAATGVPLTSSPAINPSGNSVPCSKKPPTIESLNAFRTCPNSRMSTLPSLPRSIPHRYPSYSAHL
uniref:Carboxylesterase type B domain-containing protein n=1 Tax=Panagrellus redivivus TaxID=6233 RepID=A0A7E4W9W0_PANRE